MVLNRKTRRLIAMKNIRYITSPFIYLLNRMCNKQQKSIYDYLTHGIYEASLLQLDILSFCKEPIVYDDIVNEFNQQDVDTLINQGLLLDTDIIWKRHQVRYLYIETNTYCNWKCEYCPVQYLQQPKKVLGQEHFEFILKKATEYENIEIIGLNFYNEPTIDPYFEERLKSINNTAYKLSLYTNGSGLNEQRLKLIKQYGFLHNLYLNIPSLDKNEFNNMTGSSNYDHSIYILETALDMGLPVVISIQGTGERWKNNVRDIKKKYSSRLNEPMSIFSTWKTDDRAGSLQNKYNRNISVKNEYLLGCRDLLNALYVDINGNCLMCYNDINRNHIMGNIFRNNLSEILSSDEAERIRKTVFGCHIASDEWICRKCTLMNDQIQLESLVKRINTVTF